MRCPLVGSRRRNWPESLPTSATVPSVAAASINWPPPILCWRGSSKSAARREEALVSPGPAPLGGSRVASVARGPDRPRKNENSEAEPVILPAPKQVGDYDILAEVGRGGMGVVYKARHRGLRRLAALKMVLAGEFASPAQELRFRLEAELAARVQHPNIVQVYEVGIADDGRPFFAMEFIRGLPLDEYANRHGLDLAARVGLVARVCDAVHHAHDQGVIHRDLKPANILVEEDGQPKVLDFGVARATDADLLTAAGLTRTGQLLGTPNYMSPEQVDRRPRGHRPAGGRVRPGGYPLRAGGPPPAVSAGRTGL